MKPVLKTYKCELGRCAKFQFCRGASGTRGSKLVETKKQQNGLVSIREEYYECLGFKKKLKRKAKNHWRSRAVSQNGVEKATN